MSGNRELPLLVRRFLRSKTSRGGRGLVLCQGKDTPAPLTVRAPHLEESNQHTFRTIRVRGPDILRRLTDEPRPGETVEIRGLVARQAWLLAADRAESLLKPGVRAVFTQLDSVGRPTSAKFHRAFFEHFGFPGGEKIWCFRWVSIPRRGFLMKKLVRLMLATLVLLGAISTASFADGGAPPPMCSPSHCPGK